MGPRATTFTEGHLILRRERNKKPTSIFREKLLQNLDPFLLIYTYYLHKLPFSAHFNLFVWAEQLITIKKYDCYQKNHLGGGAPLSAGGPKPRGAPCHGTIGTIVNPTLIVRTLHSLSLALTFV